MTGEARREYGGGGSVPARRGQPRRATRRPGPQEVVAADRAECVEYFAAHIQPGRLPALHRPGVDLRQAHAPTRHFRLRIAAVTGPRQLAPRESLHQTDAILAPQL